MNKITFRRKIDQIWKDLTFAIEQIERSENDMVARCEKILMELDVQIRKIKNLLQQYKFSDWSDEIYFFKNTKPKFVAKYIYYSKVIAIEASKPYADPFVLKKYYENERANLLHFYEDHKDFINYYRRKSTFLDKKYFLRFKFDFKLKLSPELYSYDEAFSTSHDHLVSQLLANDQLDLYLANKINLKETGETIDSDYKRLEWTAPKVALVELVYALHETKCFNGGQADLAEIFRWTENGFNINLGNYYKTFAEIRLRKTNKTRFLSLIQKNLEESIENQD